MLLETGLALPIFEITDMGEYAAASVITTPGFSGSVAPGRAVVLETHGLSLEKEDPALCICPGPLTRTESRTAPALVLKPVVPPVAAAAATAAAVVLTLAATVRFAAVVGWPLFCRVFPALPALTESERRVAADRPGAVCTQNVIYDFDYKLAAIFLIPVLAGCKVVVHQ